MSKIGSFESAENLESGKLSKNLEGLCIPTENDRKKLDVSKPSSSLERKNPSHVKDMSDREKIAYYRRNGMDSLADNRNALCEGTKEMVKISGLQN